MYKIKLAGAISVVFLLALVGTAQAATVSYFQDTGNVANVNSISTWKTNGLGMIGMQVTVNFSGGTSSETSTWGSNGAIGSDWSLSMADNTGSTYWGSYWNFDVAANGRSIDSIFIEGFANNVIFDNEDVISEYTTGSEWGNLLLIDAGPITTPTTTYNGNILVSYLGGVQVIGDPLYDDVYQNMLLTFQNGAFTEDDVFAFWQDTDNVTSPVPEPATMLLFGIGLGGLSAIQIRKKRS
jgi:PEP-CTERM motif-containing protein